MCLAKFTLGKFTLAKFTLAKITLTKLCTLLQMCWTYSNLSEKVITGKHQSARRHVEA